MAAQDLWRMVTKLLEPHSTHGADLELMSNEDLDTWLKERRGKAGHGR